MRGPKRITPPALSPSSYNASTSNLRGYHLQSLVSIGATLFGCGSILSKRSNHSSFGTHSVQAYRPQVNLISIDRSCGVNSRSACQKNLMCGCSFLHPEYSAIAWNNSSTVYEMTLYLCRWDMMARLGMALCAVRFRRFCFETFPLRSKFGANLLFCLVGRLTMCGPDSSMMIMMIGLAKTRIKRS